MEPEDLHLFERMEHASSRMGMLVDDLLELSRLESHAGVVPRGPVGVEQLTSYKYVVRGNGQIRPG